MKNLFIINDDNSVATLYTLETLGNRSAAAAAVAAAAAAAFVVIHACKCMHAFKHKFVCLFVY